MANNDQIEPALPDQAIDVGDVAALQEGICGACGYQLRGLSTSGVCPECGAAYTPETLSPLASSPGALEIALRFFWPVTLLLGLGLISSTEPYGGVIFLLYSIPILVLVFPLNSVIQAFLMARRHIQPAHRSRIASRNMQIIGVAAKASFYTTVLVPPLIFGGCLVLMCAGSM